MFCNIFHHPSVILSKFELKRREQYFRYKIHESKGAILQICIRDKRKTRRGQYPKIASSKSNAKMANMWFLCMVFLITAMHICLVKIIDFVKYLITLIRWQNVPVSPTSKRYYLVTCAMIYGCFSLTKNQIPKDNKGLRLKTTSWWITLFSCCNVVQHDCEIMMTLDLDFWLILCSRERLSEMFMLAWW